MNSKFLSHLFATLAFATIMTSMTWAQRPSESIDAPVLADRDSAAGGFGVEEFEPGLPPLPPEYVDVAFDRYLDLRQLGEAAAAGDAGSLTDSALRLAEGERILLRNHRSGLTVDKLLRAAAKWSIRNQDQATLQRLSKLADSRRDDELKTQIQAARKLAVVAREANSELTVSLESTDAETLHDMKRWLDRTRAADTLGDMEALRHVREAVDEIDGRLSEETRATLLAKIDQALKAADRPDTKDEVLVRLAGASRAYETNKFDLKSGVEKGNWIVAWADDISETDAVNGVAAAGISIYAGNPAPFYAWVDSLVAETTGSLMKSAAKQFPDAVAKQAKQLSAEVIKRALRGQSPQELFKQFDTVDFKAGAIRYSGRNFDKVLGNEITYSRTWGLKPYVAFRWRGSEGNVNPPPGPQPSPQKIIAYSVTNASRFAVSLEFSPTGNTARLAPGQSTTARSPVRNGEYPKLTARTSSGKYWIRTIRDQNGAYRIVNLKDGGIKIVP